MITKKVKCDVEGHYKMWIGCIENEMTLNYYHRGYFPEVLLNLKMRRSPF